MPDQLSVPVPGARALLNQARIVPTLPPDIPIVPKKRVRRWPIVLVVLVGLAGLTGYSIWRNQNRAEVNANRIDTQSQAGSGRSAADKARIMRAVEPAVLSDRPKGTRIRVRLSNGVRIFQIESSTVQRAVGKQPTTCVLFGVTDPKTGAKDMPETVCIPGLDYAIQ